MSHCVKNNFVSQYTIASAALFALVSIAGLVNSCICVPENSAFIIASSVLSSVSLILFVGLIIARYRSKQQTQEKPENTTTSGRQIQLSEEQRLTLQHAQRTECMRQTNEQTLGKPENTAIGGGQIQLSEDPRLALELDQRTECVRQTIDRWKDKNISLVPVHTFFSDWDEGQPSERIGRLHTLHEQAIEKWKVALTKHKDNHWNAEEVRDAMFECIEIAYLISRGILDEIDLLKDRRFSRKKEVDEAHMKQLLINTNDPQDVRAYYLVEQATSFHLLFGQLAKTYLLAKHCVTSFNARGNPLQSVVNQPYVSRFYQPNTKEFHARMLLNAFSLDVRTYFGDKLHGDDSRSADGGARLRSSKRAFFDLPSN